MTKPDDSEIRHSRGGTMLAGKDAMLLFAALQLKAAIALYARARIIPTRGVTISKMLRSAEAICKKQHYTNNKLGWDAAVEDLRIWCETMKAAIPNTTEGEPE